MQRASSATKRKVIDIDRGLFLVRYSAAEDEARPPSVRVSLDDAPGNGGTVILHPDAREPVLSAPGSALAVRSSSPARLLVEVTPQRDDGSTAATVQVEALNPGEVASAAPRTEAGADADLDAIRILGHVAGLGDVVVRRDEWLAGPSAPSRIEGIQVEWPDRPAGIDLRYLVKFARPQGAASQMTGTGAFAGTRGRALPITGIVLELTGAAAADAYQLSAEALFLGSPAVRSTGRRIVLGGPTGREPLVGLRLNLLPAGAAAATAPAAAKEKRGRVRVFRGKQKQDE